VGIGVIHQAQFELFVAAMTPAIGIVLPPAIPAVPRKQDKHENCHCRSSEQLAAGYRFSLQESRFLIHELLPDDENACTLIAWLPLLAEVLLSQLFELLKLSKSCVLAPTLEKLSTHLTSKADLMTILHHSGLSLPVTQ